jgi:hypothetical protein
LPFSKEEIMGANNLALGTLDLSSELEIEKYERALYWAIGRERRGGWNLICNVDRQLKRVRMNIPYENQRIFVAKSDSLVLAACAVNVVPVGTLQLEKIGFKINRAQLGICEALVFFAHLGPMVSSGIMRDFFELLTQGIKEAKAQVLYATAPERLIRGYRVMGFTEIDSLLLDGEKEVLLQKDVNSPPLI